MDFKSKIKLNIKGRNIDRFLKKLSDHKINVYSANKINRNEINIVILKDDYLRVLDLKSIYELDVIDGYGFIKIRKRLKLNSLLISLLVVGIICIYILSKITFSIEIIHTDPNVRSFMKKELENYGIKLKTFKKSYNELQQIKKQILDNHKDTLEWLEIESIGTKYIIRLEERKIKQNEEVYENQNVVASKEAIIKKIEAKNGQIIKEINSYVKKGDTIISGEISLNDEVKGTTRADGVVYGEVWYKVEVTYPLVYRETHPTGKEKKTLVFKFLNKDFELSFNKYKNKNVESKTLIKHLFLPFELTFQKQKEVKEIDEIYTIDEAIQKAEDKAYEQINSKLNDKEKILDAKKLKVNVNDSTIELEMFFTVYEDITAFAKIEEKEVEENME